MIDSNSCNFADYLSQSFTIIGNSSQILDTLSTCANIPVTLGIDPISGTNVSYTWTPSTGLSNSNIANPTATIDQETSYTLIVSNGSCVDTFIQTLLIDSLNFSIAAPDSVCLGESFIATTSGESNVFFQWEPATAVISGQGSSQVSFTATNPMTITVEATNSAGCQAVDSIVLFVSDELPDITAAANPDTIELGESSQLEAFSSAVNDFTWVYENSLSALNIPDPVATPLTTTTYTVEIDDGLCPNKTDVTVYVKLPECIEDKIFVPNAFSPNGDGNNDVFLVRSSVPIDRFYVAVYDRWGQMVYESYDQSTGWDGSFKQKQLSPAAFAWYCSGFCEGGEAFFLKGNVSLIK
jgi:gliding motility-associated-like protein